MKDSATLQQIASMLSSEKVDCSIVGSTEDHGAVPHLSVFLGKDYQDRERILSINAQEQVLAGLPNKPDQKRSQYIRVQFQVALPFQVKENAVFEVASLLHLINHTVELPGFELDELNNKVFYRYVLLSTSPDTNPTLYISILGLIMMLLDLFTESIEKLATGQGSFNDLLKQILEISTQIQEKKFK